jgi:UDP-N-acetylmuramoyl-L-alanyl-D-glutamate--2,6-diaminopimelate ligase
MMTRHLQAAFDIKIPVQHACHLRLDSRTVETQDAFFAISSDQTQLQQHVLQAQARGAAAIFIDSANASAVSTMASVVAPVIAIENLAGQLGNIAHRFYGKPSEKMPVIGITGTNGKTSCSHWIAQAWNRFESPVGLMGTLGCGLVQGKDLDVTGLTTADLLTNHRLLASMLEEGAKAVAMEVSSHALDQQRVGGIHFDTALFTNLSRDHLDYHGDMQHYSAAKEKLFQNEYLKYAIVNSDDAFGKKLLEKLRERENRKSLQVFSYAVDDVTADLGVERCEVTGRGIKASIRTPWGRGALQSRFPGGYNLLNVVAVVATLCAHGMCLQTVLEVVEQLQAVPGRTQIVSGDDDDILVVVDYAHTPDALDKILSALREQNRSRLWCVFGCGGNRDRGKRADMAGVAEKKADLVLVTTDNPRHETPQSIIEDIVAGFASGAHRVIEDRNKAITTAVMEAQPGDTILLAGKGHENYQEVAGLRLPFSDVLVAQAALQSRRAAILPGTRVSA